MTEDSKYIELLHKELVESITPDEKSQLSEWRDKSSENHMLANDVEHVWSMSKEVVDNYEPDVELGLKKLKAKIHTKDKAIVKSIPRRRIILQAAAAIALLLLSTIAINYFSGPTLNSLATGNGETKELILDDGSKVFLNENSKIEYPAEFSSSERTVRLSGEAFFDIARDEQKTFSIQTDETIIKVLGTSFNVRAYESEEIVELTVKSGKVKFEVPGVKKDLILEEKDCHIYNKTKKSLLQKKDTELNSLAWQSKKLTFVKTPLSEVVPQLERYYGIQVDIENTKTGDRRLNSTFDDMPLDSVLEIIKTGLSLEILKVGEKQYLFKGKSF